MIQCLPPRAPGLARPCMVAVVAILDRLLRREVDQFDQRAPNVQGNVADVVGVLMGQHNAGGRLCIWCLWGRRRRV